MVCHINCFVMSKELLQREYDLRSSEFVKARPIDDLRFQEEEDGSIRYVSDTTLLLNEKRIIEDIGEDAYKMFIRSLRDAPSSPYRSGNFTDDQLFTQIKSKYCQSPSEVREWVRDMLDEIQDMEQSVKDAIIKKQEEAVENPESKGGE